MEPTHARFPSFLRSTLTEFLGRHKTVPVWTAIDSRDLKLRNLTIPDISDAKVANAALWGLKKEVEVDPEKEIFDFDFIETVQTGGIKKKNVVAFAGDRKQILALKQVFADAGYSRRSFPARFPRPLLFDDEGPVRAVADFQLFRPGFLRAENKPRRDGKIQALALDHLKGRDAHDFAGHVQNRAAARTRGNGRGDLKDIALARDMAQGRDNAFGHGLLQAHGAARDHDPVPDGRPAGRGFQKSNRPGDVDLGLDDVDGLVSLQNGAHRIFFPVRSPDFRPGVGHEHMAVGDDVPVFGIEKTAADVLERTAVLVHDDGDHGGPDVRRDACVGVRGLFLGKGFEGRKDEEAKE